jgi:hypothetical protein
MGVPVGVGPPIVGAAGEPFEIHGDVGELPGSPLCGGGAL